MAPLNPTSLIVTFHSSHFSVIVKPKCIYVLYKYFLSIYTSVHFYEPKPSKLFSNLNVATQATRIQVYYRVFNLNQ